jgi:hypothetical protein
MKRRRINLGDARAEPVLIIIKPACYGGRPGTNDVLMMRTSNAAVSKVLKGLHYSLDAMLTCVRWYVAYPSACVTAKK